MVSGKTYKKYPNNLLSFSGRPIRSNVLQRKIAFEQGGSPVVGLLLRGNSGYKAGYIRLTPNLERSVETTPEMRKPQARGIYDYVKSPSSFEAMRARFGLVKKPFALTNSELRKYQEIYWQNEQRKKKEAKIRETLAQKNAVSVKAQNKKVSLFNIFGR